jgi:hypothetical protein
MSCSNELDDARGIYWEKALDKKRIFRYLNIDEDVFLRREIASRQQN